VNVSLHQLKVFVMLARHRSFTRAADASGVTQSAVSRSIRELEEEISLRLFDRTTRQVALTAAGENLLTRVAPLVDEIEAALRDNDGKHECERGVVQIASVASASASFVVRTLAACRVASPDMSVVLRDRVQASVLQLVVAGEADLGVVIDPTNLDGLVAEPLFTDPLCAVLPERHPLVGQATLCWAHLRGTSLIVLEDDTGSLPRIERALATHDVPDTMCHELAHPAAIAQMVRAGLGIGIAAARAFSDEPAHGFALRVLCPVLERTTMLVRRKNRSLRPAAATVWARLLTTASEKNAAEQNGDEQRGGAGSSQDTEVAVTDCAAR
jgi:DNA-binding transcriptional LysR family regulator